MCAAGERSGVTMSSNFTDDAALQRSCELYMLVTLTVIVGSLCIVGIIGNMLAFVVFWKDMVKTSASFLFQGLSVIDTALLATALPLYSLRPLFDYTGWWPEFANVFPYVQVCLLPCAYIAQTATIWVTVLVAVNRYVAVCMPYRASRLCTVLKARRQLAVVIVLALLYNIPKFFDAKIEFAEFNVTGSNTTVWLARANYTRLGHEKLYHIIYGNIFYLIFLLILPLITLSVLNVRLINALKRLRRRRQEMQSARQQADNNATFVLIIVVLVFTICQVPALVNLIMWNTADDTARVCGGYQFYLRCISNLLVILNSAVNFLIYFLFNTRFRHVLLYNVCRRGGVQRVRLTSSTSATAVVQKRSDTTVVASSDNSQCIACKNDDSLKDTFL